MRRVTCCCIFCVVFFYIVATLAIYCTYTSIIMELAIGQRIRVTPSCQSAIATVRYIGGLDGHPGTWVGLEWDDPTRGKNDGSVDGKRYFVCQWVVEHHGVDDDQQQNPASFIKMSRLQTCTSTGLSMCEAMEERYIRGLPNTGQSTQGVEIAPHQPVATSLVELMQQSKITLQHMDVSSVVRWGNDHQYNCSTPHHPTHLSYIRCRTTAPPRPRSPT